MARVTGFWKKVGDTIQPVFTNGVNLLIRGTNKYLNFNTTTGEDGYGIRDLDGTIQFKNSAGVWTGLGGGGSSSPDWTYYATKWDSAPTVNTTITGGTVYNYILNGVTRYRFVPTTYSPSEDAFYSSFSNPTLSGLITARNS